MDEFGRQAHTVISSTKAREAFDISKESPEFSKAFGATPLGASCLLALRLVESGLRCVTVRRRRLGYPQRQLDGPEDPPCRRWMKPCEPRCSPDWLLADCWT
ncbi:MAG UNVERIFIED_CONTAM: DUF1501 domain-containing protein, partial [Planctomycetaceae bacterium]